MRCTTTAGNLIERRLPGPHSAQQHRFDISPHFADRWLTDNLLTAIYLVHSILYRSRYVYLQQHLNTGFRRGRSGPHQSQLHKATRIQHYSKHRS